MPRYRKGGQDIPLDPETRARLDELMGRSDEERLEDDRVRDWYQAHRPATAEEAVALEESAPCFPPDQVEGVRALVAALQAERERAGLDLADVAERSGLTLGAITRLENGRRLNPTLETLYRYARAVGRSIDLGVAPPNQGLASGRPTEPDDDLVDDVIEHNPAFRQRLARSLASPREPFPFVGPPTD